MPGRRPPPCPMRWRRTCHAAPRHRAGGRFRTASRSQPAGEPAGDGIRAAYRYWWWRRGGGPSLAGRRVDGGALQREELANAGRGEIDHLIHLRPGEGAVLRRALHLDEAVVIGHDNVEVDVGRRI